VLAHPRNAAYAQAHCHACELHAIAEAGQVPRTGNTEIELFFDARPG
jgi:hypothetical protein